MEMLRHLLDKKCIQKEEAEFYSLKHALKENENEICDILEHFPFVISIDTDQISLQMGSLGKEEYQGVKNFRDKNDYLFFTILLIFLEDHTLFSLDDYLDALPLFLEEYQIDFHSRAFRQSIYRAMVFAEEQNVIQRLDGDLSGILAMGQIPGLLYKNTGVYEIWGQKKEEEWNKRQTLYGKLLFSPAMQCSEFDRRYLEIHKSEVESDFSELFDEDCELLFHGDYAYINHNEGLYFPSSHNRKDWMICRVCRELKDKEEINREGLQKILKEIRIRDGEYWTKEMVLWGENKYYSYVESTLKKWEIIVEEETDSFKITPIAEILDARGEEEQE